MWSKLRLWSLCFSAGIQPCCCLSSQSCWYAGSRKDLMDCQCQDTWIVFLFLIYDPSGCNQKRLVTGPLLSEGCYTCQGERTWPRSPPTSPVLSSLPVIGGSLVLTWHSCIWCNHLQKVWYLNWQCLAYHLLKLKRAVVQGQCPLSPCLVLTPCLKLHHQLTCWFLSLGNYLIQI